MNENQKPLQKLNNLKAEMEFSTGDDYKRIKEEFNQTATYFNANNIKVSYSVTQGYYFS